MDKREGWLRNLKVGDKVILLSNESESVRKIEKITPTGIIVAGKCRFSHTGRELISGRFITNRLNLVEYTEERDLFLQRVARFKKVSKYVKNYDWGNCDVVILKQVYDLIKPSKD